MRMKRSNLMKRGQKLGLLAIQSGIEMLLFFPIIVLLYMYISPVPITGWLLFLWLSYIIGGILAWFRIRMAWLLYSLIVVLSGLGTVILFGVSLPVYMILGWLLSAALLYRGVRMGTTVWHGDVPAIHFMIGLCSYFVASFVASLFESWRVYLPVLLWTGLASLCICLFLLNRTHIRTASPEGVSKVSSVLSKNRIWIISLIGVILFISFFQVVNQALMAVIHSTAYFMKWMSSLFSSSEIPELEQEQNMELVLESAEDKSIWSKIIEYVFYGFGSIVVLFFGGLFLNWLIKNLRSGWTLIMNWLRHLLQKENKWIRNDGYTDEKKQLIQWKELRASLEGSFKKRIALLFRREAKWNSLSDWRARVRWLYRRKLLQSMRQGYEFKQHLTPRETLSALTADKSDLPPPHPLLARYYEQARYGGDHETISDEEVEKIKQDCGL